MILPCLNLHFFALKPCHVLGFLGFLPSFCPCLNNTSRCLFPCHCLQRRCCCRIFFLFTSPRSNIHLTKLHAKFHYFFSCFRVQLLFRKLLSLHIHAATLDFCMDS
uniref:Uncharacterized protein n=1 Tax=Opuntia streptacantha TaxID=393608 RepID=A0A7C9DR60_OPUST